MILGFLILLVMCITTYALFDRLLEHEERIAEIESLKDLND